MNDDLEQRLGVDEVDQEAEQEQVASEEVEQEEIHEEEVEQIEAAEETGSRLTKEQRAIIRFRKEKAEKDRELHAERTRSQMLEQQLLRQQQQVNRVEPEDVEPEVRNQRMFALQQAQIADSMDLNLFTRSCFKNAHRERLADEVENAIKQARNQGNYNLSREQAYVYLRGREAEENDRKAEVVKKKAAAKIVESRSASPSIKSNVSQPVGKKGKENLKSLHERLKNVSI